MADVKNQTINIELKKRKWDFAEPYTLNKIIGSLAKRRDKLNADYHELAKNYAESKENATLRFEKQHVRVHSEINILNFQTLNSNWDLSLAEATELSEYLRTWVEFQNLILKHPVEIPPNPFKSRNAPYTVEELDEIINETNDAFKDWLPELNDDSINEIMGRLFDDLRSIVFGHGLLPMEEITIYLSQPLLDLIAHAGRMGELEKSIHGDNFTLFGYEVLTYNHRHWQYFARVRRKEHNAMGYSYNPDAIN